MSGNLGTLEDACRRLRHTTRSLFGGHGLFAPNGGMFAAVVDEDRIILKFADEPARNGLVALGGEAWTYAGKMTMREWILIPDGMYDDGELLEQWAARAHALAPAKKKKAPAKKGSASKKAAVSKKATPARKKAAPKKAAVRRR